MRDTYFDSWKGGAVLAVVAIHACAASASFPPDSVNALTGIVIRQVINWPVALFVFLAAYFAAPRLGSDYGSGSGQGYVARVTARVWRLALPYLLWSAIYSVIRAVMGDFYLGDLPQMLLTGTSVAVGYYVIVMIQMCVISPLLERMSSRGLIGLLIFAVGLSCGFTYSARMLLDLGFWGRFPGNTLPFFVWLPFYIGGLLAARHGTNIRAAVPAALALAAYALALVLSFAEAFSLPEVARSLVLSQLKLSSMLTSGAVCLICVVFWRSRTDTGWLVWLGQRSYYFYLSHMLVLVALQMVLRRVGTIYDTQILFIAISTGVTLICCTLGALILDRLFASAPGLRRALGLA